MKQTHKICKDEKCRICMADHLAVGDRLDELTGNDRVDHMGRFHSWLKKHEYDPETEYGWGTEYYFNDELIEAYAIEYRGEEDEPSNERK